MRVEPRHQPANFGAVGGGAVDRRRLVDRFLEIFADRHRIDQRRARAAGVDHHRRFARGVHVHELVAPLPRRFAHQLIADALFTEQQPHLAAERAQGELVELPHACGVRSMGGWREAVMAPDKGVRIIDGVIHIDHAEIEAGLRALAARWQVTVEEALGIVLRNALAEQGLDMPGQPTVVE
ncbi:hypothetical protein WR25_10463 [Diploscapter pachys]|uniref:Uncharacterized protein n=2 Tax=cellular organisms TaxID=131567 RepID=A0A2A2K794_9BILA|nr:hypothetical protein WR25_10463 [Diploscapter pachys]